MKKRKKIKHHKGNVFLFPNVDKLLMEKGLESIQNKKFSEAIEFLEKAQELDQYNEEVELGLIIAYFESGNLLAAKKLTNETLLKGLGDYYQLIDLYIMILLQLNEYEEIVSTIETLLEEKEVPIEKLENFTKILEFSQRKLESENQITPTFEEVEDFNLFEFQNLNDQFLAIAKISQMNVRAYLKGIKEYLKSSEGHPFIKTMLLQLLKEQEVNEEMLVDKFQQKIIINPINLERIESLPEVMEMTEIIKQNIEQENPTLYENVINIVSRDSFLLFPLERRPNNPSIWAAAYHFIALEYFGETLSIEEIAEKYKVEQRKINEAVAFIRELEEISSPVI